MENIIHVAPRHLIRTWHQAICALRQLSTESGIEIIICYLQTVFKKSVNLQASIVELLVFFL